VSNLNGFEYNGRAINFKIDTKSSGNESANAAPNEQRPVRDFNGYGNSRAPGSGNQGGH